MDQQINAFSWSAQIDLVSLAINLLVAFILGMILRWHFKKFGSVLSNRDELGQILPTIALVIVLIISIVKSSLALSLGLVGALSIVRFRTPIKEPEELTYLFISIAIGLGLGAGQRMAVLMSFALIIVFITMIKWQKRSLNAKNLHIIIHWQCRNDSEKTDIEMLKVILEKYTSSLNLRRLDMQDNKAEVSYVIDVPSESNLACIVNDLRQFLQNVNVTFLDQNNMPRL